MSAPLFNIIVAGMMVIALVIVPLILVTYRAIDAHEERMRKLRASIKNLEARRGHDPLLLMEAEREVEEFLSRGRN